MYTIYYNSRCRKSRAGLQYLQEKGIEFEVVEYLKNPINTKELENLLAKLNKAPQDIVRKQEDIFKKQLKGKNFSKSEWVKILVENPRLIQRPIIVKGYKAVIGDPVENIDILINKA